MEEYSMEKMDFEVVKQKIIKANEILHLYQEKTEKLNRAAQAFKCLKANYEKATQQINTLRLSNEHLTETLEIIKPQKVKAETELSNVKADYASLEEKYQEHMIETQLHITDLEAKIHKCFCKEELSPTKRRTPEEKIIELTLEVAAMKEKEHELNLQVNKLKKRNTTLEGRGLSRKSELNEELRVVKEKLAATEASLKEQNNHYTGLLKNKKKDEDSLRHQITQLQLGQQRLKMVEAECNLLSKEVRTKEANKVNCFIQTEDVKLVKYVAQSNISTQTSLEYFPCSFEPSKSNIFNKTSTFLEATKVTQYDQEEELECSLSGIFREMILPMSMLSPTRSSRTTDSPLSFLGDFLDSMDATIIEKEEIMPKSEKEEIMAKSEQNLPDIVVTPPTPSFDVSTAQYPLLSDKLDLTRNQQKIEGSNLELSQSVSSEKSSNDDITVGNIVVNAVDKSVESAELIINSGNDIPGVYETVTVHSENGNGTACIVTQDQKSVLDCKLPINVEESEIINDKGVNQGEEKIAQNLISATQSESNSKIFPAVVDCSKIEAEPTSPAKKPSIPEKAQIKTVPIQNRPKKFWLPYLVPFIKPKSKRIFRQQQPINAKDTILRAIQTLKRNNINFSITNESGQWGSCSQPKLSMQQLLREIKDHNITPNRFKKPHKLLRHRRYKNRDKINSEFLSETESEIEKLFKQPDNILERNKRLLEEAKKQAVGSDSEIMGDSGLVTASSKLDSNSSICSDNEVPFKAPQQKIDIFDLYKSPFCPTLLSPMTPSVKGSPPENAKVNIKSSVCQKITFDGLTEGGLFTVISYNKDLAELDEATKEEGEKVVDLVNSESFVKSNMVVEDMEVSSAECQTKIKTPVSVKKPSDLVIVLYHKEDEDVASTRKTNMILRENLEKIECLNTGLKVDLERKDVSSLLENLEQTMLDDVRNFQKSPPEDSDNASSKGQNNQCEEMGIASRKIKSCLPTDLKDIDMVSPVKKKSRNSLRDSIQASILVSDCQTDKIKDHKQKTLDSSLKVSVERRRTRRTCALTSEESGLFSPAKKRTINRKRSSLISSPENVTILRSETEDDKEMACALGSKIPSAEIQSCEDDTSLSCTANKNSSNESSISQNNKSLEPTEAKSEPDIDRRRTLFNTSPIKKNSGPDSNQRPLLVSNSETDKINCLKEKTLNSCLAVSVERHRTRSTSSVTSEESSVFISAKKRTNTRKRSSLVISAENAQMLGYETEDEEEIVSALESTPIATKHPCEQPLRTCAGNNNGSDRSLRSRNKQNLEPKELLNIANKKCQGGKRRRSFPVEKNLNQEKHQIDVPNAHETTEVRLTQELTSTSKSIQDFSVQNAEGAEQVSKTSTETTADMLRLIENTHSQEEEIRTVKVSPLRRRSSGLSSLGSDADIVTHENEVNYSTPFQHAFTNINLANKATLIKQTSQAEFDHFKLLHKARNSRAQLRPYSRTQGQSSLKICSKEFVSDSEAESTTLEIQKMLRNASHEEPKSTTAQYRDLFGDSGSDIDSNSESETEAVSSKKEIVILQDGATTANQTKEEIKICQKTKLKNIAVTKTRYQTRSKGRLKISSIEDSKTNPEELESTNLEIYQMPDYQSAIQQERELFGNSENEVENKPATRSNMKTDAKDNLQTDQSCSQINHANISSGNKVEIRPVTKRNRTAHTKDNLKIDKSYSQISHVNFPVPESSRKKMIPKTSKHLDVKNATAPVDLISNVIQGMIKTGPKMQPKKVVVPQLPNVSKPVQKVALCDKKVALCDKNVEEPEPLEDPYQDCPKSPDPVAVEEEVPDKPPKLIPWTIPQKFQPSKIVTLMQKLIVYSNEEVMLDEVVMEFAFQDVDHVVRIIMNRLCLDVHDKADNSLAPSPPMTTVQRILFGFLLKLEKITHPGIIKKFMKSVELQLLNKRTRELSLISPLTRIYTALCKMTRNLSRIRRFLADSFYFCENFAVPVLFVVITMWPEVLPMNEELPNYLLAKVIVQLTYTKTCVEPGFNLLPLRDLFARYYHYPTEQWNAEDVFRDVLVDYVQNPSVRLSEYTLLLFLRYQPIRFLDEKIKGNFIPLYEAIPDTNPNLKATLIMTICNITCKLFRYDSVQLEIICDVRDWAGNKRKVETHPVVRKAIALLLQRLPHKPRAKNHLVRKNKTIDICTESDKLKSNEPKISEVREPIDKENNQTKVELVNNKITILKDNESEDSASELKLSSGCEDSCSDFEF